ncbi:MAG: ATP-binding cassette domain-containing protein [Candidatus Cloacimonas sp.]|jgi:sodium transport system ATP-binding protein|nr:ATP-binding cassette domain-containing protein [Candidatus Cloacimonadota bacterium]
MIQVEKLTKTFKNKKGEAFKAVDNFSFTAKKGEIVSLLGVNGAGKTTMLRMLSTILKPDSGDAYLNGYSIRREPGKVRSVIGFLSGDTGLYGRLTPREILTYFGRLYDVPDPVIKERIAEMAELLDMNEFLDRKVDVLSTGMKQKVSISRSIIHDPPIMIFDEPTSGLDILTARTIVSFINKCKEDGKCILFSTHVMRETERIADKVEMIHKGAAVASGSLEELRLDTGFTDLDDIFVHYVNKENILNEEIRENEF